MQFKVYKPVRFRVRDISQIDRVVVLGMLRTLGLDDPIALTDDGLTTERMTGR
jgi:hypothetical protein